MRRRGRSRQPREGAPPSLERAVDRLIRHENVDHTSAVPFKSQAQRRKFAQLLVEGKISNETYEEWNRETGARKLPERVKRKASKKPAARSTRNRTARKR